jgi:hypothetical protein
VAAVLVGVEIAVGAVKETRNACSWEGLSFQQSVRGHLASDRSLANGYYYFGQMTNHGAPFEYSLHLPNRMPKTAAAAVDEQMDAHFLKLGEDYFELCA